jgi:hypothetical protein
MMQPEEENNRSCDQKGRQKNAARGDAKAATPKNATQSPSSSVTRHGETEGTSNQTVEPKATPAMSAATAEATADNPLASPVGLAITMPTIVAGCDGDGEDDVGTPTNPPGNAFGRVVMTIGDDDFDDETPPGTPEAIRRELNSRDGCYDGCFSPLCRLVENFTPSCPGVVV